MVKRSLSLNKSSKNTKKPRNSNENKAGSSADEQKDSKEKVQSKKLLFLRDFQCFYKPLEFSGKLNFQKVEKDDVTSNSAGSSSTPVHKSENKKEVQESLVKTEEINAGCDEVVVISSDDEKPSKPDIKKKLKQIKSKLENLLFELKT